MEVTAYEDINRLLDDLLGRVKEALGEKLVGLYLYGSLVWGDFDYDISDIDLLAVTALPLDEAEFSRLERLHNDFVAEYSRWTDRLEIAYLSLKGLQAFRTERSPIAVISPGEPFNLKEAGYDWLINWYVVQERGVTLDGPQFKTLVEPISKEEFIQAVQDQVEDWRDYVVHTRHSRPYQAYTILTMCRALYAYRTGQQVSKKQAARWAEKELPHWAGQIQNALRWREDYRNNAIDHEATYPAAVNFVNFVADTIKTENRPELPGE